MPDLYDIVTSVAYGHAYDKHVDGNKPGKAEHGISEFNDPEGRFGNPVSPAITQERDLANFMQDVVNDPNTKAFYNVDEKTVTLVNADKNVIIELNNSVIDGDAGSIFRFRNSSNLTAIPENKFNTKLQNATDAGIARSKAGTGTGVVLEAESVDDVKAMIERFATENAADFRRRPGRNTNASANNPSKSSTDYKMQQNATEAENLRAADPMRMSDAQMQTALSNLDNRIAPAATVIKNAELARVQEAEKLRIQNERAAGVYKELTGGINGTLKDKLPAEEIFEIEADKAGNVTISAKDGSAIYDITMAPDGKSAQITSLTDAGEATIKLDNASRLNHLKSLVTELELNRVIDAAGLGDQSTKLSSREFKALQEQSDLLSNAAWTEKTTGKIVGWLDNAVKKGITTGVILTALAFGTGTPAEASPNLTSRRPLVEDVRIAPERQPVATTPEGFMDKMRSTVAAHSDNVTINYNSAGYMSIEPIAPNANAYEIQIGPNGKTADVMVTTPEGIKQVLSLDEEGTRTLNSMMQSEFKGQIPPLDKMAPIPPLDVEVRAARLEVPLETHFNNRVLNNPDLPQTIKVEVPEAAPAKALTKADDLAEGLRVVNAATDAMKAGKAGGKMAKLTWVGGAALTGGVAALIHWAHSSQRDLAGKLNESGELSDEAYQEYLELNTGIETEMQTENLAGQGWLFLVTTPAVEASARSQFNDFSAKHGLSPELHKALGMSLFDGTSLGGKFAQEAIDIIPDKMSDMDPEFHKLWRATENMHDAEQAYKMAHIPLFESYKDGVVYSAEFKARRLEWQAETDEWLKEAKFEQQKEFARLLSDPETGNKLLAMMPQDVLMDMVEETAQYHAKGHDPLIGQVAYLQDAIDSDETGWLVDWHLDDYVDDAMDELEKKPEAVYAYIRDVFGDDGKLFAQPVSPEAEQQEQQMTQTLKQMPDYMQHRVIEAAMESAAMSKNQTKMHPYLRDLSRLYKNVDNDYLHSSRRESLNEQIEELETEILKNPEILSEYALEESPEVQAVINEYNAQKSELDRFAEIPESKLSDAIEQIEQDAKNPNKSMNGENPLVQKMAELHEKREEHDGWFFDRSVRSNIDEQLKQIKSELRQNPDVVSDYMKKTTGDSLIEEDNPNIDTLEQQYGDDLQDFLNEGGMSPIPDQSIPEQSNEGSMGMGGK
ncbi:MAG: hypothetical protein ACRBDL_00125 [Alphaproteobacteria bacterium]